MQSNETAEIMRRFNQAFLEHDPAILEDLVGPGCVMESIQPAPDGTRYEGYDVCLAFWQALAADRAAYFEVEDTIAMGVAPSSAGASISAMAGPFAASI